MELMLAARTPTRSARGGLDGGQLLRMGHRARPGQRTPQRRDLGANGRLVNLNGHQAPERAAIGWLGVSAVRRSR
jgi:hypothetical protein